jgi:SAM-dependent methyltransferase
VFYDDIALVTQAVGRYGLRLPFADLGGHERPLTVDYERNVFGRLTGRPFEHLAPGYVILNPDQGDPAIEDLEERDAYGTVTCLSVLEHARDPQAVFDGLYRVVKPEGLAIVSTVFEYRYHGAPDYWRFSPDGLRVLAEQAHFDVLECDWRLDVPEGILIDGSHCPVKSVYVICQKAEA